MGINEIIIYIMVGFMVLGAVDKCLGNKFGYGEKFEEGVMAMGALALAMIGIMSLAPVLGKVLEPIVAPFYRLVGADPAMFAGTLLACDMGGYPLAKELTTNVDVAKFSGIILGSMMGATIVFTIPVALGIIEEKDREFLAKGVLAGIITIPIGAFFGGIVAGYGVKLVVLNLIPIIIVASLIAIGLALIPDKMIKGFTVFGKGVVILITFGLVLAIIEALTGKVIIKGMESIEEGYKVVGGIAMTLAGAYPLVHFITKVFNKPLLKIGGLIGVNDKAAAGFIATLANNIPMFGLLKEMDTRGKIVNVAFAVSAAFVFGDHLGYVAGEAKDMIFAMVVGKLIGGVSAVVVAMMLFGKKEK